MESEATNGHISEKKIGNNASFATSEELNSASLTQNERLQLGKSNTEARLENPLVNLSNERLVGMGAAWARKHGMPEEAELFSRGALLAQDPTNFENIRGLSEEDRDAMRVEYTHKWRQPATLYYLVVLCSVAAAVQGMDESVISGANLFYPAQFGIDPNASERNQWLQGLVSGAPYLCCATFGCWLTDPLNRHFGRRGTIFISAIVSFVTCIWAACTNTWWHLFIARFFLGVGIGPKSATVPVFSAECSPAPIRGALVMMWQTWTAFGIALGYVVDMAFEKVPNKPHITGLNWRLMLGSAGVPALILAAQVFFVPESPRWLLSKGRAADAFKSLCRLRNNKIQAARDLFYMSILLEEEENISRGRNRFLELFTVPRNRRATQAATIVMFMQQFCGVNVIVYYVSTIFVESGFSVTDSLAASLGFGLMNAIFALPAVFTIDKFGRRTLLLITFPLMAAFLLVTGFAFFIPLDTNKSARVGVVALGIYLYDIVYSIGEGPVPFTYSAEAFPLYVRELGMSWATTICWLFNFIVALTFPRLLVAFKPQGAFGWYAGWNVIGWFLILLFVPETKALTLEELDQVFSVPTAKHASYFIRQIPYFIKKNILRSKNVGEPEHLYYWTTDEGKEARAAKAKIEQDEVAPSSANRAVREKP